MNSRLLRQHLFRAWHRHWGLQVASVTVMTLVLVMLNFLFLGYSAFNRTMAQWGHGLEMIVYLKEGTPPKTLADFEKTLKSSGDFGRITYTNKQQATADFLKSLGGESLELLSDPKWSSPIPANYLVEMSDRIPAEQRLDQMKTWSAKMKGFGFVEDVFYGQGWVENFARFLGGARGLVVLFWAFSLSVGLLIVSNCIRLSFSQRRDEIEIMELVGATARFIRLPFLLEGIVLGFIASVLSLGVSYALHSMLLHWLSVKWSFWLAIQELAPLRSWYVVISLLSGIAFGALGSWNCVRKLNTGWSAAAG